MEEQYTIRVTAQAQEQLREIVQILAVIYGRRDQAERLAEMER